MDLGIAGKSAIVCASSQGLGLACAASLAREGVSIFINGRSREKLESAAVKLRDETGAPVRFVVADITTESGRQLLFEACPSPDILITNNAGPPPGKLEDWTHHAWLGALESNMLAPALMIRMAVPGMRARKFGRIVNITSAMVKSPRSHQGLSTAARAALTALSKAISLEAAVDNVTINNILPERIDSDRTRAMTERTAKIQGVSFDDARAHIVATIAAKRMGLPHEVGDACAYLCSVQASYISGQNLQLDGGSYPGLL